LQLAPQQASPSPPQGWHTSSTHTVNEAEQPTPEPQQGWPTRPQVPSRHAPSTQVPASSPHASPLPAQVSPTQQPPPSHAWPGQHGWPGPPHSEHVPAKDVISQTVFGAVQKRGPVRLGQHCCPTPPQVSVLEVHEPPMQVVTVPQSVPSAAHVPATQQPPAAHVVPPQQGWSSPPQVT
jgi:hypothetical protein